VDEQQIHHVHLVDNARFHTEVEGIDRCGRLGGEFVEVQQFNVVSEGRESARETFDEIVLLPVNIIYSRSKEPHLIIERGGGCERVLDLPNQILHKLLHRWLLLLRSTTAEE